MMVHKPLWETFKCSTPYKGDLPVGLALGTSPVHENDVEVLSWRIYSWLSRSNSMGVELDSPSYRRLASFTCNPLRSQSIQLDFVSDFASNGAHRTFDCCRIVSKWSIQMVRSPSREIEGCCTVNSAYCLNSFLHLQIWRKNLVCSHLLVLLLSSFASCSHCSSHFNQKIFPWDGEEESRPHCEYQLHSGSLDLHW